MPEESRMGKDDFEPRMSFSHARTKPVVVEKVKRRAAACPSCGGTMQLVRSKTEGKLIASCPRCGRPRD
jgi:ribosomal protein L37AE/L43A